jgi:dihydrofolate reductase
MNFELIVALNKYGIIGINNKIPWHIPEDLMRFKKMTEQHIVVMGRKTFESLPPLNRPLKNRINIVLTSTPEKYENIKSDNLLFSNAEKVFKIIHTAAVPEKKVFIIGGSDIYKLFLNYCSTLHITHVYPNTELDLNKDDTIYADTIYADTISYFPYSFDDLFAKGFILQEKKPEMLSSKNETVKFKYSTYIRNPY